MSQLIAHSSSTYAITVSIRIHAHPDCPASQIDILLPTCVSFGEIAEDILTFAHAPRISEAWHIRTRTGHTVDPSTQIRDLDISPGDLFIFSPYRADTAPCIKDAADALADAAHEPRTRGLLILTSSLGCISIFLILTLAPLLPVASGISLILFALFSFALSTPKRHHASNDSLPPGAASFTTASALPATGTTYVYIFSGHAALLLGILRLILGDEPPTPHNISVGLGVAALVGLLVVCLHYVLVHAAYSPHTIFLCILSLLTTVHGLLLLYSIFLYFFPHWDGPAALCQAFALIGVNFIPSVSMKIAGLRVARIPATGVDLSLFDDTTENSDQRALAVINILAGYTIACALVCVPFLFLCAHPEKLFLEAESVSQQNFALLQNDTTSVNTFTLTLMLAVFGATFLHGSRHFSSRNRWALWIWGLGAQAAFGCATLSLLHSRCSESLFIFGERCSLSISSMIIIGIGALMLLGLFTSGVWGHRSAEASPVTQRWWERIEMVALALTIPVSLNILGLFDMIRGL